MTTPAKLNGAPSCVTIDGIDLHSFGMIVNNISNPVPGVKSVTSSVPNRDGDMDFSKFYGSRSITLSGSIMGDTNAQLLENIDHANTYFRLRKNGQSVKIVFQNQTDRYWTCKYTSFQHAPIGLWKTGHIVSFTLNLKCVKPYAEATTITSESFLLNSLRNKKISYAGTLPAPITLELTAKPTVNLFPSTWFVINNATRSTDSTNKIYGANADKATRTGTDLYRLGDSFPAFDKTKNYVVGVYAFASSPMYAHLQVQIIGGPDIIVPFVSNYSNQWHFAFAKVSSEQMATATNFYTWVEEDAGSSNSWFTLDGYFIYEISAAEYADANYVPPPFVGSSSPAVASPRVKLHKSINIFPLENGEYVAANWAGLASTTQRMSAANDPLGGSDRCYLFSSPLTTESLVYAPPFFISGGKYYKISFDYFVEKIGASPVLINMSHFVESVGLVFPVSFAFAQETSVWATQTYELQSVSAAQSIRLVFSCSSTCKFFIKNIQVVEAAASGEAFDAYQRPDASETSYVSTLDADDSLVIDTDKFVGDLFDASAGTLANAMASLNIGSMLLQPGYNCLRYSDARVGAATPETASAGAVAAKISYRARYL
jgi:hypothetical protein